jgi:hypothetical protein
MVVGKPAAATVLAIVDGKFRDDRWVDGRWVLSQFAAKDGTTDWDAVRTAWKHV